MRQIYLDHAATTPVRPEVRAVLLEQLEGCFGNPSSHHRWGREARNALEEARERVAAALGAERREIVFTSGGTESDNLAVLGRWRADGAANAGPVVYAAVEHKAVGSAAGEAGDEGGRVIVLGVDGDGQVDLGALKESLLARPCVVSVMWGNNEVGTIQPVAEIAALCRDAGTSFHSDAVQALGKVRVRVDEVAVDLLSLTAHKIGGPKGVGALFIRDGVTVRPLAHGGGQERQLRPGTENVAAALALAVAVELAVQEQVAEAARLTGLRDRLQRGLQARIAGARVNGGGADRLPHVLSLSLPDTDAEALLVGLDLDGLAVSGGSACHSGSAAPSHVLVAMGQAWPGAATIRLSLGHTTTAADIDGAIDIVARVVAQVRQPASVAGSVQR